MLPCFTVARVSPPKLTRPSDKRLMRLGLPLAALSVVDLAIWDLVGKIRGEPICKMIGGRTKKDIPLYLTGPKPPVAKKLGFWGSKVS